MVAKIRMHGGEVDEGYCIVNSNVLEESMPQRDGREKISGEYFKGVDRVKELIDGYSFHFPAKSERVENLVEFIRYEQKNNPTIKFELIFQQNETVLHIHGDLTKEFVKSWAPSWVLESPYLS